MLSELEPQGGRSMMSAARLRVLAMASLAAVLMMQGCSAPKPPPAAVVPARTLEITVRTDPGLNPDARGRAAPVVLRIYELKVPQSFLAADFFSLFEKDQSTLGADMASREELQLRPGDAASLASRELKPEVRAIGVFVAYRDIEKSRWRALHLLPPPPAATTTPPPKPIPVPVRVVVGAREVTIE